MHRDGKNMRGRGCQVAAAIARWSAAGGGALGSGDRVRQAFLDYFQAQDHTVVPSSRCAAAPPPAATSRRAWRTRRPGCHHALWQGGGPIGRQAPAQQARATAWPASTVHSRLLKLLRVRSTRSAAGLFPRSPAPGLGRRAAHAATAPDAAQRGAAQRPDPVVRQRGHEPVQAHLPGHGGPDLGLCQAAPRLRLPEGAAPAQRPPPPPPPLLRSARSSNSLEAAVGRSGCGRALVSGVLRAGSSALAAPRSRLWPNRLTSGSGSGAQAGRCGRTCACSPAFSAGALSRRRPGHRNAVGIAVGGDVAVEVRNRGWPLAALAAVVRAATATKHTDLKGVKFHKRVSDIVLDNQRFENKTAFIHSLIIPLRRCGGAHSASGRAASTTTWTTWVGTCTTTPSSRCWATGPSATTSRQRPSTGPGSC